MKQALFDGKPITTITFPRSMFTNEQWNQIGVDLAEVAVNANQVKTKSEFRRMVEQGAVRINDVVVRDQFARLASVPLSWLGIEGESDRQTIVLERE